MPRTRAISVRGCHPRIGIRGSARRGLAGGRCRRTSAPRPGVRSTADWSLADTRSGHPGKPRVLWTVARSAYSGCCDRLWSDGYTLVFTRATRYTGRGDTPKRQAPTDKTAHSNTSARGDIMCSRRTGAVSSDLSSLITPPPWPCVLRRAQASHACCAWRAAR